MIRMAFMTDKAGVIGDSTPERDDARFELLPDRLPEAMAQLYEAEDVAVGAPTLGALVQAHRNRYVLTRDRAYQPPQFFEDIIVCNDYRELVDRYEDSDDELLVVGGKRVFDMFLPHAKRLDVAETDELVPGDLVLSGWKSDFELESSEQWEGFRVLHYVRRS